MLQKIRDKISGWFAAVFLGAIAVVFVFWGIRFEGSVTSAAAKVNGQSIPVETIRRAWQERQTELAQRIRDELPPELVKSEQKKLLDEFIAREVIVQRAHESGYRIGDAELAETLRQIPALQVDGKFSRDRYAALLRQQGRSEPEFEREFRRDLETNQLRNAIAVSAFVTPGEMKRRLELEGETREVSYAVVPAAKFAGQVNVTPEAVAAYYAKHKTEYMTPETVSLQYLKLDLADLAANVQVTEEGLRKYYEDNAARNEAPEQRKASHILIESGSDDAAAKKKAEAIAARVKAGEDFAKLARENSDDPGSKDAGGDLGWATREAYVKEFSDALFAMQKGEIRGPVHTQFGYHIIRLDDIQTPHVRSFEEVRGELEPEYRKEQAQSAFYEKSQQLADESFAALSELASVAKKLGMKVQTIDSFTRQGGGALGSERKVIDAAFSEPVLQERQNSAPVEIANDSVVVLRVTDYKPSHERPLEEVRDQVVQSLTLEAERQAAADAARAMAQRVNAGEPFATVTAAAGVQPTAAQPLTRIGAVNAADMAAPIAPEMLKAIFQAPRPSPTGKPSAGTATLASGDQAVFVISAVHPGDAPKQMAAQPDLAQRTAQQTAAVEVDAYTADLQRTAKIKRNDKVFATE